MNIRLTSDVGAIRTVLELKGRENNKGVTIIVKQPFRQFLLSLLTPMGLEVYSSWTFVSPDWHSYYIDHAICGNGIKRPYNPAFVEILKTITKDNIQHKIIELQLRGLI